jgi:glutathione reductase (NADPH)
MTAFDFDLFVIGGGSGGVRAARIAASHGARVAIAEDHRFGGTCVIRGCVPKKLLVYASRFRDEFEDARGFGWTLNEPTFDWPTLIAAKNREITRIEGVYRGNLEKAGVTVLAARARLEDAHTVHLSNGKKPLTAGKILIATGGAPFLGETIEGLEHAITSNEAFDLKALPKSIVIYGGGYIAMEFACIFAGLGSQVTIVYRGGMILRGFDHDLRDGLTGAMRERGIRIVTNRTISAISKTQSGVEARLDNGMKLTAGHVMFAIGRMPATADLGLEAIGVERGWNGHVVVDEMSRTNIGNIFAVGDVTDRLNLTPAAIREGHAFADSEFGGKSWTASQSIVPTAVFTTPELATVGYAEDEAPEHCGAVDIYKSRFRTLKDTLAGGSERMMMKLVVSSETGKVVGCHVLGPDAAEIVQMAAIAMRMGATKADFDATLALHPSAAEELVTMREKWLPPAAVAAE